MQASISLYEHHRSLQRGKLIRIAKLISPLNERQSNTTKGNSTSLNSSQPLSNFEANFLLKGLRNNSNITLVPFKNSISVPLQSSITIKSRKENMSTFPLALISQQTPLSKNRMTLTAFSKLKIASPINEFQDMRKPKLLDMLPDSLVPESSKKRVSFFAQINANLLKNASENGNSIDIEIKEDDEFVSSENDNEQAEISPEVFIPPESNMSQRKSGNIGLDFAKISFILKEYPEDADPLEFFKQKTDYFLDYFRWGRLAVHYCPVASSYHFNCQNEIILDSAKVILTNKSGNKKTVFVPFSIAYFMINCPRIAGLCFMNEALKKSQMKICGDTGHLSFEICNEAVSILAKENETLSNNSHFSKIGQMRKSAFRNIISGKIIDFTEYEVAPEDDSETSRSNSKSNRNRKSKDCEDKKQDTLKNLNEVCSPVSISRSHLKSESECPSQSDSDDSKSNDSMGEEEYQTTNLFELKYSMVEFVGEKWVINIEGPVLKQRGLFVREVQTEEMYRLLNKKGTISLHGNN